MIGHPAVGFQSSLDNWLKQIHPDDLAGLQQQIAAIKALPDVRMDKVEELTRRVEAGQYQVDAAKLADQMIGRALADKLV